MASFQEWTVLILSTGGALDELFSKDIVTFYPIYNCLFEKKQKDLVFFAKYIEIL